MLSLSQTAGYAIRAMVHMDGPGGQARLVREIAERTGISKPYLSKIIHALALRGMLKTKRGYKGGVTLAREATEITVIEVADAFDGPEWLERCILGLDECTDERACPLHEFWKPTRIKIRHELSRKTLAEVAEFEKGRSAMSRSGQLESGGSKPAHDREHARPITRKGRTQS